LEKESDETMQKLLKIKQSLEQNKQTVEANGNKPVVESSKWSAVELMLEKEKKVEVTKKDGKLIIVPVQIVNKSFIILLMVNILLIAIIVTKILGAW